MYESNRLQPVLVNHQPQPCGCRSRQMGIWRQQHNFPANTTAGVTASRQGRKEGNVLFNNTLNTLLFTVTGHQTYKVKENLDSERRNPLQPHRILFPINSKGFLYAPSHRQDSTYHSLCYTSRGSLAGMRNSSMGRTH